MKLNKKEVKVSLQNLSNAKKVEATLSEYSHADNSLLEQLSELVVLRDLKDLSKAFSRSAVVVFSDDDLTLKVGDDVCTVSPKELGDIKVRDFVNTIKTQKTLKVQVLIRKGGDKRKNFEKNKEKIATDYALLVNQEIEKVMPEVREDTVYLVTSSDTESEAVFDGTRLVAAGNSSDFYPGCHGLYKYKGIKLGEWQGSDNLADIVSTGLNKKVKSVSLTQAQFELVVYKSFLPKATTKSQTIKDLFVLDLKKQKAEREEETKRLTSQKNDRLDSMVKSLREKFKHGRYTRNVIYQNNSPVEVVLVDNPFLYDEDLDEVDSKFENYLSEMNFSFFPHYLGLVLVPA